MSPHAIAMCIAGVKNSAAIAGLFGIFKNKLAKLNTNNEADTGLLEKLIQIFIINVCECDNINALDALLKLHEIPSYGPTRATKVRLVEGLKYYGLKQAVEDTSYQIVERLLKIPEIFDTVRDDLGQSHLLFNIATRRKDTLEKERVLQLLLRPEFLSAISEQFNRMREAAEHAFMVVEEFINDMGACLEYVGIYETFMLPDNATLPTNQRLNYLRVLLAQIKYCHQEQLSKYAGKFAEIISPLSRKPGQSREICQIFEACLEDANFIKVLAGLDDANLNSTIKMLHKAHNPEKILNALIEAEKRYNMDTAICIKAIQGFLTTECTDKKYKGVRFGQLPSVIECLARNAKSKVVKDTIEGLSDKDPEQVQLQLQIISALQRQIDTDVSLRTPELLNLISNTMSHLDIVVFGLDTLYDLDKKPIKLDKEPIKKEPIKLDWDRISKWIKLNVTSTTQDPAIVELAEEIHNWQAKQVRSLAEAYEVSKDPELLKSLTAALYRQQRLDGTLAAPELSNFKLMAALWEQLREKNKQKPDSNNNKPSPR